MSNLPNFDELVGRDVPRDERERLRHAHELLIEAGPPPELSPELENVPWPEEALGPVFGRRKHRARRPVLLAAALATAVVAGFVLGQVTTNSSATAIDPVQTVHLRGTALASAASGSLELGQADRAGNWPMVLQVKGLPKLRNGGYYDLYLTKNGVPLVSCGTVNSSGETVVRMSVAYDFDFFDKDGWVVVRKSPSNNFATSDIVLRVV